MSALPPSFSAAFISRRSITSAYQLSNISPFSRPAMSSHRQQRNSSGSTNTSPTFTYRLAAASVAKHNRPRPPRLRENFWTYTSTQEDPHPPYLQSTKKDSGEDAFFASTVGGSRHHVAFGVTDGVGGWQDQGVDPSHFSQGLCESMVNTAHSFKGIAEGRTLKPREMMQTAYEAVLRNSRIQAGGSTASLACADGMGNLETANLGDSGYLVLGPGKVAHRSTVQTHAFNTPYQMSKIPSKLQAQHAIFGGATHFSETPAHADVNSHQLKHGDIVVFATDGVWDNLSAQDTLAIVTRIMEEKKYWVKSNGTAGSETLLNEDLVRSIPTSVEKDIGAEFLPGQLAAAIMRMAKLAGLDRKRDGPFAKEVKLRYPQEGWEGGKPDDIAVVVCIAVQSEAPLKAKL